MNNISDVIIRAVYDDETCEKGDIFFRQAEEYSPYIEVAFKDLNEKHVNNPRNVEVNVLWRFSAIFQDLLELKRKKPEHKEAYECIIDTILHSLSELDLRHGVSTQEFIVRQLRVELLNGDFGKIPADIIRGISKKKQLAMANELYAAYRTGSSVRSFSNAVKRIYPNCRIYHNKIDRHQIYVYIDHEQDREAELCIEFLKITFLPGNMNSRIFWKNHFGILGVDNTMILDRIAMF